MPHRGRPATAALLILLAVAPAARATSPWLPDPGAATLRGKLLVQRSDRAYCPVLSRGVPIDDCVHDAERVDYPSDGVARSQSVYVEGEIGLVERLALDFNLNFRRLEFDNLETGNPAAPPLLNNVTTSGPGDLTLGARLALLRATTRVAPYLRFKIPLDDSIPSSLTGAFPLDERQLDIELGAHFGHSFWPAPAYARGRAAYRARQENEKTRRDPGDEVFLELEGGYRVGRVLLKAGLDWLRGEESTLVLSDASGADSSATEPAKGVTRIVPGVYFDISPAFAAEASLFVPVAGRNYPAGPTLSVGVSAGFSLFGRDREEEG